MTSYDYTQEEKAKIGELRTRVLSQLYKDEFKTDDYFIRWLRARAMNVDQAEEMLLTSLEWRKTNNIDGIEERESIPDEFKPMFPFAICGHDKEGAPMLIFPVGRQDALTLLEKVPIDTIVRYNVILMETICSLMRKNAELVGKPVYQFNEILDLEGLDYNRVTSRKFIEMMGKIQAMFNDNYPEMFKKVLAVNAPKVFAILFHVMKPMVPKATLDKVDIYGPDKEQWKAALKESGFPLELIPPHWGGSRKGSDDLCSQSEIWFNGKLDLHYFNVDHEGVDYTKVKINPGDRFKIDYSVEEGNTMGLKWTFKSEGHDIAFGILYEKKEPVLPMKRVQANRCIQSGTLLCKDKGLYSVVFDNTYSFARSKTILYDVKLLPKEEIVKEQEFMHKVEEEIQKNLEMHESELKHLETKHDKNDDE